MKYCIGNTIREIRKKQRLTMKEVAKKVNLSESLISQIENDKISPSIDTLLSIAEVLNIDFDYLFNKFKKPSEVSIVKKSERTKISRDKISYELLSKINEDNRENSIEAYYLEIKPGNQRNNKHYGHKGWELGIIIDGKAEMQINNSKYKLSEGDSISFNSDKPHVISNIGEKLLKAYWIVTPPKDFI